jgi:hypothetical protein
MFTKLQRNRQCRSHRLSLYGEDYNARAFVPNQLSPPPPLELDAKIHELVKQAQAVA